MSTSLVVIVGGAVGGLALVVIVIIFICFCMFRCNKFSNRNSDTGSSDPSALVEWNRGEGSTSARHHPVTGQQGPRQFTLEELEQATKQFSESNLIGEGSFGLVYSGLLSDGNVIAVKRRLGTPRREFVEEVNNLLEIRHRNLVTLLGYCQEDGFQMLVYEYLPNGSISSHLHDSRQRITPQLEFKQRLSIAMGAAKGLCHLHGLTPPLVHNNFKTSNVLVDESFIAKVADAGVYKLLKRIEVAGPSRTSTSTVFQHPEVGASGVLSEMSDVYSFGVFLLEIISGEELSEISFSESGESLIQWVKLHVTSNSIVDGRLVGSFTSEGMKDLLRLTLWCLGINGRGRPKMEMVVMELDRILEKEMTRTTVMGESTATFTLGSELFTPR